MKKILLITCFLVSSCLKTNTYKPLNKNLKTKTLPELKAFLKGTWKLHYKIEVNGGWVWLKIHETNTYITFFDRDSILWTAGQDNIVATRDQLTYTWKKTSYSDSAFVISFFEPNRFFKFYWIADRLENDTLVFMDDSREGNSYHLTRKL